MTRRLLVISISSPSRSKPKWMIRFLLLAILAVCAREFAKNSTHALMRMVLTTTTDTTLTTKSQNPNSSTRLVGDDPPEEDLVKVSRGKTVLVTGGAGFIGSHVAEYCARKLQMRVVVVDNLSGGTLSNVPLQLESIALFVQGDVKDAFFLADLFHRFDFDYVYHLAAYAAIGLSPFIRSFNYRNNMVATAELLNFCRQKSRGMLCLFVQQCRVRRRPVAGREHNPMQQ